MTQKTLTFEISETVTKRLMKMNTHPVVTMIQGGLERRKVHRKSRVMREMVKSFSRYVKKETHAIVSGYAGRWID